MGKFAHSAKSFILLFAAILSSPALANAPAPDALEPCHIQQQARPLYLNILTRNGTAFFSTSDRCEAKRHHALGRDDASGEIRAWFEEKAETARDGVCMRLPKSVQQITIDFVSGQCGGKGILSNPPSAAVSLNVEDANTVILGCRSKIADQFFGGIALHLPDGYSLGDFYASNRFYAAYDRFGTDGAPDDNLSPNLSDFNTYHYDVRFHSHRFATSAGKGEAQ